MEEDPIAVLESRILDLEQKLFGQSNQLPEVSLTDHLLESHKVVSSAMSGREKIVFAAKRIDELESVLDPMYEDSIIDSAAKLAFILSMEHELEGVLHQLGQVSELGTYLESEQLRNIPHLKKQLSKLASTTIEDLIKSEKFDEKMFDLTTKFSEINSTVTAVIATVNSKLQEVEIKLQPIELID